jgi:hypothetical protein
VLCAATAAGGCCAAAPPRGAPPPSRSEVEDEGPGLALAWVSG